jgi:hypothetical protein
VATADSATKLIGALTSVPDTTVPGIGAIVAGVALTAGKREPLTATLESYKPGTPLRAEVYAYYLDYLGAEGIADMERLAKSTAPAERYRATSAPGIAVFDDPSGAHPPPPAEVRTVLCDFAKGFVADADAELAAGARDSMGRCAGPYIDAMLDDLEARLAKQSLDVRQLEGIHRSCWSEVFVDRPANGTLAQCSRALGLLEKQATAAGAPGESLRAVAVHVGSLARFLDDAGRARGKALLDKLAKHPDKSVVDAVSYSKAVLASLAQAKK